MSDLTRVVRALFQQIAAYRRQFAIASPILVCALLLTATPVNSAPITFSYEGTVTSDGALGGTEIGKLVTLEFTFESTTADVVPIPSVGFYPGAVTSAVVTLGTDTWTSSPPGSSTISVESSNGGLDRYIVTLSSVGNGADRFTGLTNVELQFSSPGGGGTILPSDALPTTPPDPSIFDAATLTLTGMNPTGIDIIASNISIAAVPAPPAFPFLGAGLLAVGVLRRRRVRQKGFRVQAAVSG